MIYEILGGLILLKGMMTDEVKLVKKNGEVYENIKANVQTEKIFITDETIPIEEGDKLQRKLPSGMLENYIVLDRGFYNVDMAGMKPHYQCKVKKESSISAEKKLNQQKIYNVTGENSRVNINSTDNSMNVIDKSSDELFEEIRNIVNENIKNNEKIIKTINEMESNKNKESFMNSYQKFISSMSNHMSLIAPFIPALSQFFT